MAAHDRPATLAAGLFEIATLDASSERRSAADRGIAFEAKPTADGTRHGYPVPWEAVPAAIKDRWRGGGASTKRRTRAFFRFDRNAIRRASSTNDA